MRPAQQTTDETLEWSFRSGLDSLNRLPGKADDLPKCKERQMFSWDEPRNPIQFYQSSREWIVCKTEEAGAISVVCPEPYESYFVNFSVSPLERDFNDLASKWYRETRRFSSAEQMVLHPSYQQIIGMGTDALPFILKEMKRTRGHWLWALVMITREDQAKPGQSFREAVDSWLEWGESLGYI